jgi:hypothetical protein
MMPWKGSGKNITYGAYGSYGFFLFVVTSSRNINSLIVA